MDGPGRTLKIRALPTDEWAALSKNNAEIEGTATTPSAANDDQLPNPLKTTHEVDQYHDEQRVRDAEINDALKEIASGAPSK